MSLKGQKCRGMASKWHIDGIILDMRIEEKGDNNNEVFLRVTNHTGQAEKNLQYLARLGFEPATFGMVRHLE